MKYLKKINESINISDIEEDLIFISDNLGQRPKICELKYGKSKKYHVTWDLKIDFSKKQSAKLFVKKLKQLSEDIEDIISLSEKLKDYDFIMKINYNQLFIEIIPKELSDYNFIGYIFNNSCLMLIESEIERFFLNKGIIVNDMDLDGELPGSIWTNYLEIYLDKLSYDDFNEFKTLIEGEFRSKIKRINANYFIVQKGDSNSIKIFFRETGLNIDLTEL